MDERRSSVAVGWGFMVGIGLALGALGAGCGGAMGVAKMSDSPPPPSGAESSRDAVLGTWVAHGDAGGVMGRVGPTDYVLVFEPERAMLSASDAAGTRRDALTWSVGDGPDGHDGHIRARGEPGGGATADEAGTSCREVVAVESDELLVKVGTLVGACVLGDEVLHFARQTQR
ncbi:MAG: hypothetical protein U1F43_11195 [Myxococcota bacterium]